MNLNRFDCRRELQTTLIVRSDIIVRTTNPSDFIFINSLMKEESACVGFLAARTFESYVWGGQRNFMCFLCLVNNQPVGYVLLTPGRGIGTLARLQQIAIRRDARLLEYGRALVDACLDFAQEFRRLGISLRCRADLEANRFWKCLGFQLSQVFSKGTKNHMGFTASNDIFEYIQCPERPEVIVAEPRIHLAGNFPATTIANGNLTLFDDL